MKILAFTKYTRQGASSRQRTFQFIPCFKEMGHEVVVQPLFDDEYLQRLYQRKSVLKSALMSYLRRFLSLRKIRHYDLILVEKELFPYLPYWAECWLAWSGIPYIVDYDDAIFHNYDRHPRRMIRWLLGNKIPKVMKNSAAVVVGNTYLEQKAKLSGAAKTAVIPTVVDVSRYQPAIFGQKSTFIVGWIGTLSTFTKHVLPCRDWIVKLHQQDSEIEFRFVGVDQVKGFPENTRFIKWSEQNEPAEISCFDVGIMPLTDSDWEKGKCGYKLVQYGAATVPMMASDVGMNHEVCQHNVNGFLAHTEEEWMNGILQLKNNPKQREKMGKNARILIEQEYSLTIAAKRWGTVIDDVMQ